MPRDRKLADVLFDFSSSAILRGFPASRVPSTDPQPRIFAAVRVAIAMMSGLATPPICCATSQATLSSPSRFLLPEGDQSEPDHELPIFGDSGPLMRYCISSGPAKAAGRCTQGDCAARSARKHCAAGIEHRYAFETGQCRIGYRSKSKFP